MGKDTINSPIFLIKFGKKEYLEQIKNGIVRFTKLKKYQENVCKFQIKIISLHSDFC